MSPCVVLFDDIELMRLDRDGAHSTVDDGVTRGSCCCRRLRVCCGLASGGVGKRALGQLLNELDGVEQAPHGVLLIATTTHPGAVDAALLRPGRLDHHVCLGLPTVSR